MINTFNERLHAIETQQTRLEWRHECNLQLLIRIYQYITSEDVTISPKEDEPMR